MLKNWPKLYPQLLLIGLWRGAVNIASASGAEDPGSNPARGNIAMPLCFIDLLCIVCVLKNRNKVIGPNLKNSPYWDKFRAIRPIWSHCRPYHVSCYLSRRCSSATSRRRKGRNLNEKCKVTSRKKIVQLNVAGKISRHKKCISNWRDTIKRWHETGRRRGNKNLEVYVPGHQGCQMFLDTIHQNGGKYTEV
jgi:hypothetical protein